MIAYFDCFSGISGDMTLAALIDAGGDAALIERTIVELRLDAEIRVIISRETRGHLSGTRVTTALMSDRPREMASLVGVVSGAQVPERVRAGALDTLRRLGVAEAHVHQRKVDDLHLHELGGADTMVDIVAAHWMLQDLGISEVYASALPTPRGLMLSGMPLPAPAVLEVLADTGAIFEPVEETRELVTPTGAALLATLARFVRPAMRVARVGYGIGAHPSQSNSLRVWLGQAIPEIASVIILETNVDDMPPNQLAGLTDELFSKGAIDVFVTAVVMKKGRSGHLLTVLTDGHGTHALVDHILRASSTLGVRISRADRAVAARESRTVGNSLRADPHQIQRGSRERH